LIGDNNLIKYINGRQNDYSDLNTNDPVKMTFAHLDSFEEKVVLELDKEREVEQE
jgi:hypothetical protein